MDLKQLLLDLGLWDYFPGKLNNDFLLSVRQLIDKEEKVSTSAQKCNTFISKLTYYDNSCRYFETSRRGYGFKERRREAKINGDPKEGVHPLDISTAVFFCCDHVARQVLVLYFWGCKHAFPFVIKTEQLEPPFIYLRPVKTIISKFGYSDRSKKVQFTDHFLNIKVIGAIRFSSQDFSKSHIMNMILSRSEKIHSSFFHRNCAGSTKVKSDICKGLIEAAPVLNASRGHHIYLNLRGNCKEHTDQTNFLMLSCNVLIVVCKTDEIGQLKDLAMNNGELKCELLLIVFTDLDEEDRENIAIIKNSISSTVTVHHKIVAFKGSVRSEFVDKMSDYIDKTNDTCSIDELEQNARNHFPIDVDEIRAPIEKAETLSKILIEGFEQNNVNNAFPIQGKECVNWSKAESELYRLRQTPDGMTVRIYRQNLQKEMHNLRSKQFAMIMKNDIKKAKQFMDYINNFKSSDIGVFLQSLTSLLESAKHKHQTVYQENYISLLNRRKFDQLNARQIDEELKLIEDTMSNKSLSLLDVTRELGQIYETVVSQNLNDDNALKALLSQTTEAAAGLLLLGYQVEIMDGRTKHVPIKWVQSIFSKLQQTQGKVRIKVITVLGVQSSGKSTLLNTMFGTHFAVGSGRCTRGACMQLIKVSKLECPKQCFADYLLIVDTEGMFSTAYDLAESSQREQDERVLATFIIGLSDVTILNIMGENLSYLKDVLQVAVHAFLRMDLVGLNPKCRLLHHNVNICNERRLLEQAYGLESVLDKCTKLACDIEKVSKKRFNEIIRFNITQDIDYFPPLFEYIESMDIISRGYSKAVMQLKSKLLSDGEPVRTLQELSRYTGNLWNAVKTDNFVYEFKNVLETEARMVMEKRICQLQWKIREELKNILTDYLTELSNCDSLQDLEEIKNSYRMTSNTIILEQTEKNCSELFKGIPDHVLQHMVWKLKDSYQKSLQMHIKECKRLCFSQFDRHFRVRQKDLDIMLRDDTALNQLDLFLDTHLKEDLDENAETDVAIEALFRKWLDQIWTDDNFSTKIDYEDDAIDCIYTLFEIHRSKVDAALNTFPLAERDINTFLDRNLSCHVLEAVAKNWQTFKKTANQLVDDLLQFVKNIVNQIRKREITYHPGIFKDIILRTRTHQDIYNCKLPIKPTFEIELSITMCSEFISRVQSVDLEMPLQTNKLVKNAEPYFKTRCREKLRENKTASDAVKCLVGVLLQEICRSIINNLPGNLASTLKEQYRCLDTKRTLLLHIWKHFFENEHMLLQYIRFPEGVIQKFISNIFDNLYQIDNVDVLGQMQYIIANNVSENVQKICMKIQGKANEISQKRRKDAANAMEQCVEIIKASLSSYIEIHNIQQYQFDIIENSDRDTVIQLLLDTLGGENVKTKLCNMVSNSVKEFEYYKLRNETVQILIGALQGCTEKCPFCGEQCCIGQENHEENHRVLMHRPTGFLGNNSEPDNVLASSSCWEEQEFLRANGQLTKDIEQWFISSDVFAEENSFWKYLFIRYKNDIAALYSLKAPDEMQESWCNLSKTKEMAKLEDLLEHIQQLSVH